MSYLTKGLLTLQLLKNSIDTQEKLRLNLHSLSVSVSELLEYGRKTLSANFHKTLKHCSEWQKLYTSMYVLVIAYYSILPIAPHNFMTEDIG